MSGMLILFLLEYSASIHRRARFEFGGGIPRIVDIQLNEEGAKSIKNLGLLPDAEGILQNVKLVHETSRSMYVLIPEAQWREGKNIAVEIPHAKIIAVGYRFTRK